MLWAWCPMRDYSRSPVQSVLVIMCGRLGVFNARISGLRLWLEAEFVINGIAQSLLATQIPFGCLHANVSEQELNLLELATGQVA